MEDILGTKVENILYFIQFFKLEVLGKHGRNICWGRLERLTKNIFETIKGPKKDIMNVIINEK